MCRLLSVGACWWYRVGFIVGGFDNGAFIFDESERGVPRKTIVSLGRIEQLLFFFALVNINLAVVNFLPIPITDGGHMIFLIWEQITGKPVSLAVQNAATLAGLVLIVAVFLFVTYNDISRLLGS